MGWNFDGFWTDVGGFSTPKIDQNRYQFRDRFLDGLKIGRVSLGIRTFSSRTSPKDTFGVLTGPHTVVQWSRGPGTRDWGLVLGILHAVCRWPGEFMRHLTLQKPTETLGSHLGTNQEMCPDVEFADVMNVPFCQNSWFSITCIGASP